MIDRLKHELCYRLWRVWHVRLCNFFDGFTPTEYGRFGERRLPYAKYVTTSRPFWHLCCNGDCGGWRTSLCDRLEHGWRYSKHARGGET